MQLEYLNNDLRRAAGEPDFIPAGWSGAEIRHLFLLAQCSLAATAASDLINLRVLGVRCDTETPTVSVQLSAHRRVVITFKAETSTGLTAVFDISTTETDRAA